MASPAILRTVFVDVVIPSGSTTSYTQTVCQLTGGLRVVDAALYVPGSLGASVTLSLGDTGGTTGSPTATTVNASATRYVNAGTGAAAGKLSITDTLAGNVGFTIPNSGTNLVIGVGGATTGTAQTVTVKMVLAESF